MAADLSPLAVSRAQAPWLAPWLAWLDAALHREVLRLRARYELSVDELQGLYVSDAQVDAMLRPEAPHEFTPDPPVALIQLTPLERVGSEFGLTAGELTALVIAVAPEIDRKYRALYAYLNDDVTRPLPTIDLCLRLASTGTALLDSSAPVYECGLVQLVPAPGAPQWRHAGLVLTSPVREYLLAVGGPRPAGPPVQLTPDAAHAAIAISRGTLRTVLVEAPIGRDGVMVARGIAAGADRMVIETSGADPRALGDAALRARLHGACLLVRSTDPIESLLTVGHAPDRPVLLVTTTDASAWQPALEGTDHVVVRAEARSPSERAALWTASLRARGVSQPPDDVVAVADLFALSPSQIDAAAAGVARDRDPRPDLTRHARAQCSVRLPALVTQSSAAYGWDDLVLPAGTVRRLRELTGAIRHRHQVFDNWAFRRLQGSRSLIAMFSGVSGTGKTMSAAVIARELGLPLCRLDLSAVVSKYIGETEKNLEAVFRAVEASNALLMFDEADALFGKRSEVSDAHDRYANIEVAYLLQRVERFDGVLLLATNLSANVDEAFSRRIHYEVEFPVPDRTAREQLWARALPPSAPVGGDVDLGQLARMVSLSGGEIRNAALTAAFLAAHDESPIGMSHLVRGVARQRRRQGKLPTAAEYGEYLHLVSAESA